MSRWRRGGRNGRKPSLILNHHARDNIVLSCREQSPCSYVPWMGTCSRSRDEVGRIMYLGYRNSYQIAGQDRLLGAPGGWGSPNFHTFGTIWWQNCQRYAPAAFNPKDILLLFLPLALQPTVGLWPVEQCPPIFSHLPPTPSIFSHPAL